MKENSDRINPLGEGFMGTRMIGAVPRPVRWVVLTGVALWPATALAHVGSGVSGSLVGGVLHPVTGLCHLVAMVAIGLWGVQLGGRAKWVLPMTFVTMMVVSGALGIRGVPLAGTDVGIAVSAVVLGFMILGKFDVPLGPAAVVVGFFAVFHGHVHGMALANDTHFLAYSIGFVFSTVLLHALGMALGEWNQRESGPVRRVVEGTLVMFGGLIYLVQVLR